MNESVNNNDITTGWSAPTHIQVTVHGCCIHNVLSAHATKDCAFVLSAHATKDCAFSPCYKGLWFQHMLQRTVLSAHATKDYAFSQCYRKTKKGNEGDQFWCTSYKDIHTPWNWVKLLPAQRCSALVQCLLFCLLTISYTTLNNSAHKFLCGYNVHLEKPPHLVIQCNFATFKADQEQHILHYNGA
jgi:hypothetical protein